MDVLPCGTRVQNTAYAMASYEHVQVLLFLYWIVEDHDILFKLSEGCHLIGLTILLFKLHQAKSAAGAFCPCVLRWHANRWAQIGLNSYILKAWGSVFQTKNYDKTETDENTIPFWTNFAG